jgi:hypothetical protein
MWLLQAQDKKMISGGMCFSGQLMLVLSVDFR